MNNLKEKLACSKTSRFLIFGDGNNAKIMNTKHVQKLEFMYFQCV